ncbi:hypothetical protein [Kitasatospora sp. McL0602]|uniref:hypothetical protein n=1 Tax=Kitasatospora sp. McL0602 TaxID=3439530 RepID=UPI003F8B37C9
MRSATALRPRGARLGRGWYLAAVLSAALAVGMCLLGWRQADQADRIAAHPVRVEGTVTQLPTGSATYSAVSYRADGQLRTAADLWLPGDVKVGDPICLEHAAADPGAVRVCGKRYPQPVGISLARISVPVALLLFAACAARIWRHRRVRVTHPRIRTTVAFATEGMPALTHGKRSRRRRSRRRHATG